MDNALIIEYEDILIGRRKNITARLFYGKEAKTANHNQAVAFIKYVIENILCWTDDIAIKKFDKYIIKKMKMEKFISYIEFPPDIEKGDPTYILSLIYPNKVHLNEISITENLYKKILLNDEKGSTKQFPRDYFAGTNGFKRYAILVKYLLDHYMPISSLDALYNFFLSTEGTSFLNQYRLLAPAKEYNINIIEVLHYLTKENPDGELYYCYYLLNMELDKLKSSHRFS